MRLSQIKADRDLQPSFERILSRKTPHSWPQLLSRFSCVICLGTLGQNKKWSEVFLKQFSTIETPGTP